MDKDRQIEELEALVKQHEERVRELKEEIQSTWDAVSRANEQTQEWYDLLQRAKEAYGGDAEFWERYDALRDERNELLKEWNKFVPQYNAAVAPKLRNFGRPLAASPVQRADVLKRRGKGQSLRSIAGDTGLSFQTVRTIIDKANGVDRATLARLKKITPDKFAEAHERVNRSVRKGFPKRIEEAIKSAEDLRKELKGLGASK